MCDNIFMCMRKIKLTESQVKRLIQESQLEHEMLSTYRMLVRKLTGRANSIYGQLQQITIGDLLSGQAQLRKYEEELWALRNANDATYKKISNYVERHSTDDNDIYDVESTAHDIQYAMDDKIQAAMDLCDAMGKVVEAEEEMQITKNFRDIKDLEV